jgi:hypothetical protein
MELFEISGTKFYFDLESISNFVRIDEKDSRSIDELFKRGEESDESEEEEVMHGPMVDMTKWELVKGMMESILTDSSIVDEDMGITMLGKQLSIPFRLSFNTLVKHKLIKISK